MPGHHLGSNDNLDALAVGFHGRRLKGIALRHAVTHLIKTRCLVLVDLGLLINAGVKACGWQRPGPLAVAFETLADGLGVFTRLASLVLQTARTQVDVEVGQVLLLRYWRGPASLQCLDAILHVRLFIAACRHTKQRFEHVVACQSLVTRMQLPLPATADRGRHRLGIVPPNFARHTAEELEPLHHAFEDRFGTFTRQSHSKRAIRVRPYQRQHGNLLATIGKIDVNVSEVRFQSLAWIMRQRDKSLDVLPSRFANVAAHGIVTTRETVLITQPFEDAAARMPLFGRRLFIGGKHLLDNWMKTTKLACWRRAEPGKRLRLRVGQCFAHLAS